jgi:hypothetical protein
MLPTLWPVRGVRYWRCSLATTLADNAGTDLGIFFERGGDIAQERIPVSRPDRRGRIHDDAEFGIGKRERHGGVLQKLRGFSERRKTVNETLMKQFPNATKPFWRFRANVLKRFTCRCFPNDAPRTARLGVEQGTTNA